MTRHLRLVQEAVAAATLCEAHLADEHFTDAQRHCIRALVALEQVRMHLDGVLQYLPAEPQAEPGAFAGVERPAESPALFPLPQRPARPGLIRSFSPTHRFDNAAGRLLAIGHTVS